MGSKKDKKSKDKSHKKSKKRAVEHGHADAEHDGHEHSHGHHDHGHRFAIVVSRFNESVTQGLLDGAVEALKENGVEISQDDVFPAPGAFEIPLIAKHLAATEKYAGVIGLGCVIKGETAHFEFISLGATYGIMQAMLDTGVPISFGILTTYNDEQADLRSRNNAENKGREAALACMETAHLLEHLPS